MTADAIPYVHAQNLHSAEGPRRALPLLLEGMEVSSLLDVGCGTGTWLRAALDLGIADVLGVDGVAPPAADLAVREELVLRRDLTAEWGLGRVFDVVLCLEVAEHLPAPCAAGLVRSLAAHGTRVLFSAASPWQSGQHHVNCQWPEYWQGLFNQVGYCCRDSLRWKIWPDAGIEPWYRQNLFLAEHDPLRAGTEARIPAVVHPDLQRTICEDWRRAHESWLVSMVNRGFALLRGRRAGGRFPPGPP